jgi:hypothetical protein
MFKTWQIPHHSSAGSRLPSWEGDAGLAGSGDGARVPTLWGRKSVLTGMAAAMGVVFANAAQPSSAAAATVAYIPTWAPSTAYPSGLQVVSPNNDVVCANVAHTSSAAFATDTLNWTLSSTYRLQSDIGGALSQLGRVAPVAATRTTTSTVTSETSMPENIIKVGSTYWLLYSHWASSQTTLHLASSSSPDGPWTPYAGNPVLTAGGTGWESSANVNGGALIEQAGTFYLFYATNDTNGAIGVAIASSVTGPYTKSGSALLTAGSQGAWDSLRVNEPSVLVGPDGVWVMAYMGEDSAFTEGTAEKIGIATAPGPLGPWTKATANPVIGFGDGFDKGGAADPSLIFDDNIYWCLYSGLNTAGGAPWQLGLAWSLTPAGPWTRHQSNPILRPGASGAFDANSVWRGAIYEENGIYYLPYGGIPASGLAQDAQGGSAHIDFAGLRMSTNLGIGQNVQSAISTGINNVAVGDNAQAAFTTGHDSVAVGFSAGRSTGTDTGSSYSAYIGTDAGYKPNGVLANATVLAGGQTFVGYQTGQGSATGCGSVVALGKWALVNGDYASALGAKTLAGAAGAVAIGTDGSGNGASTTVANQIALGTANHTTKILGRLTIAQRTPTSSADASGNVGDIASDDTYVYAKTSTGWKRSAITTW